MKSNIKETLSAACESYLRAMPYQAFTISDIERACYAGCDWNTNGKRHPKAKMIADRYIEGKSMDVTYTPADVARAFTESVKQLSAIIERDENKKKLGMLLKKQDLSKVVKLLAAGQQLMDLANNFQKEAEELLTKQGVYKTTIKSNFTKMSNIFKQTNSLVAKTFKGFTDDEVIDWGEDGEKLEIAVREVFEIDK